MALGIDTQVVGKRRTRAVAVALLLTAIGSPHRTWASPIQSCSQLIIGPADVASVARGLFCATANCAVLDLNGDGQTTVADIPAGLKHLAPCDDVDEIPGLLDVGEDDEPQRYQVFNRFTSAAPGGDGEVVLKIGRSAPTLTYAVSESEQVYAALSFGGEVTLGIDAVSTARALVATNPFLLPADPGEQLALWELIQASQAVAELADMIDSAYVGGRDISEDPAVAASLAAAVLDVLTTVDAGAGGDAGTPNLPPGACSGPSIQRVCNFDMVHLTLAGSAGSTLRIDPSSAGSLRLRTNVDWVARVVQLDAEHLPTNFVFFPDALDAYVTGEGLDQEVIVRGEVAGGWFLFVVDPIAFLAENVGQLRVPSSVPYDSVPDGIQLHEKGVYAVVAVSGSWANDVDEYLAMLESPWQRELAKKAVFINLASLVLDLVGIVAPIGGSELATILSDLAPFFDAAFATITNQPERAGDAIAAFLVESIGRVELQFAAAHALPNASRLAVKKFASMGIRAVTGILNVWSAGIKITTRLGGMARNVSPRESGYTVYAPADRVIETVEMLADGTVAQTTSVLDEGSVYRIVISGLYRYDTGERGEFADAQFRENDSDLFSIRYNSIVFNGERLDAVVGESNPEQHTFVFYVVGDGAPLNLRIYDDNYRDNDGSLTAQLHGPTL